MNLLRRRQRYALSLLFRRNRTVLVSASSPMNVVVMRPVLDVLLADPRIEVFFTGKYQNVDDARPLLEKAGLRGVRLVNEEQAERLKADVYLSPDGTKYGRNCYRRVLSFHGASFKGRSIVERAKWFHKVMLIGEYQRRTFVQRGIFADDASQLLKVGMPKLDALVNGTLDVEPLRKRFGIAPGTRCVLYAPTWTEFSSLATMGEAMLSELARRSDVRVLVKLHDHLLDPTRSTIDWGARARAWTFPNVVLYEDVDVVPALALADVLISDASSVSQEFALLDRPLIYCDVPELYQSERYRETFDSATWGQKAGLTIQKAGEINAALDRCFANPSEFSELRRQLARDVFYHPGSATPYALAALYRELRCDAPPEVRKQIKLQKR